MLRESGVAARQAIRPDRDFRSARCLIDQGKLLKGFWLLSQVLAANPSHVPALLLRGELLFNARRYRTSRDDFLAALRRDPESERACVFLGLICGIYGQLTEGKIYFERALRKVPSDLSVRWLLADTHFRLGEFSSAIYHFKRILQVNSGDTRAQLDVAYAHFHQGELSESLDWFQRLLKCDPSHVEAATGAAKICLLRGLPDHAMHYLRRVLRADPSHADALTTLGYLHYYRGATSQARTLVDSALRADASHLPALLLLGGLEVLSGRRAQNLAEALGNLPDSEPLKLPFVHRPSRMFSRRIWLPLERPAVYQR